MSDWFWVLWCILGAILIVAEMFTSGFVLLWFGIGALAAAFAGKDAQTLRGDAALTDMGRWSDGWPVKRLSAADAPRSEPGGTSATKTSAPPVTTPASRRRER